MSKSVLVESDELSVCNLPTNPAVLWQHATFTSGISSDSVFTLKAIGKASSGYLESRAELVESFGGLGRLQTDALLRLHLCEDLMDPPLVSLSSSL